MKKHLFQAHELAFHTQYSELKERIAQAGALLPGTPGSLKLRASAGGWYRVFYLQDSAQTESWVCTVEDDAALQEMHSRIELANWVREQVTKLRKLGFQVADKATASVLVELSNRGFFQSGLVLVGTLAYMAWLNELGVGAVSARTLDIDLARRQALKLAAPLSFLETMQGTGLPFVAVPGLPSTAASTSVKLAGAKGLRVDFLAPGKTLGKLIRVPELDWAAQTIPFYDYLLEAPEPALMLAGGHAIPVALPQAARLMWHKLYASGQRKRDIDKSRKDVVQAITLGAVLAEEQPHLLIDAFKQAPAAMQGLIAKTERTLDAGKQHPQLLDVFETLGLN